MGTNKWISVKEKLPKENINVLVADNLTGDDASISTGLLWKGVWEGYDGHDHAYNHSITHWMPLPKPPKE